jgi:type VI secretion system (T6SS) effector TldE1-like protein
MVEDPPFRRLQMWTYIQKTGELLHDGQHTAVGYSGFDDPQTGQEGKNNPDLENIHEVGPIPVGKYSIGPPHDTLTHGPFVLPLTPDAANQMFGRTGFLIHGDSVVEPGTASRGCVIMNRNVRNEVVISGDTSLEVISGVAQETQVA